LTNTDGYRCEISAGGVSRPNKTFEEYLEQKHPDFYKKYKHYTRNRNNICFPEVYDVDFFEGWNYDVPANCHQFSSQNRTNYKIVSPDGKYEVIYDENNRRVDDPRDVGTYNFVPSGDSAIGHFIYDILPWIKWGNSPCDTTTTFERLLSLPGFYI